MPLVLDNQAKSVVEGIVSASIPEPGDAPNVFAEILDVCLTVTLLVRSGRRF